MESQNAEKILNVYTEGKALIVIVAHKESSEEKGKKRDAATIKKCWGSFLGPESYAEARSLDPERYLAFFFLICFLEPIKIFKTSLLP